MPDHLPTARDVAIAAVTTNPIFVEGQKEAAIALIERLILTRDHLVCDRIQSILSRVSTADRLARAEVEALFYPKAS